MFVIKANSDVAYEWSHDTCKSADNFHSLFVPNTTPSHYFSLFSFLFISHLFISFSLLFIIILLQLQTNKEKENPISKLFKLGRVNNESTRFILYIIILSSMEVLFHSLNQIPFFSNHMSWSFIFCTLLFFSNFLLGLIIIIMH
jgi:hypothetical protein